MRHNWQEHVLGKIRERKIMKWKTELRDVRKEGV